MGAYGTTVPEPGTTAGSCGSTAQKSSTTASLRRARLRPSFRRDTVRRRNTPRSSSKGGAEGNVYVRFHPKLSKADPLLIVRLSYHSNPPKRNVGKTLSALDSEGQRIVLCLKMRYLKCSMHTVSPQMHCHQSPKPLRDKYVLTISPFLVD